MTLMINHPTTGNVNVKVTNDGDNRAMIHDGGDGDGGDPPTWTVQPDYQGTCIDRSLNALNGGMDCADCMLPPVNGRR